MIGGDTHYMKLISWNVNGLRACLTKGFPEFFEQEQADIFCIQETKMQEGQVEVEFPGYYQYWNSAEKKGYSGTAVFTKQQPITVTYDIGDPVHKGEGRAITLEYDRFYLVNVYTPNAQRGLARLDYRMAWEDAFRDYLKTLDQNKPVILCGDLNVAHQEIDLKNPKTNVGNAGFPTKNAINLHSCWIPDLSTLFEHYIQMKQVRIHGGPICLMHVQTMRDGVLIILCYQKGCVLI